MKKIVILMFMIIGCIFNANADKLGKKIILYKTDAVLIRFYPDASYKNNDKYHVVADIIYTVPRDNVKWYFLELDYNSSRTQVRVCSWSAQDSQGQLIGYDTRCKDWCAVSGNFKIIIDKAIRYF